MVASEDANVREAFKDYAANFMLQENFFLSLKANNAKEAEVNKTTIHDFKT